MSNEFELVEVMKQQATGLQQNAAVNAASVAQRQREQAEREEQRLQKKRETEEGWTNHFKTNAIKLAVELHKQHSDRSADDVLIDADKFLAWFKGERRVEIGSEDTT